MLIADRDDFVSTVSRVTECILLHWPSDRTRHERVTLPKVCGRRGAKLLVSIVSLIAFAIILVLLAFRSDLTVCCGLIDYSAGVDSTDSPNVRLSAPSLSRAPEIIDNPSCCVRRVLFDCSLDQDRRHCSVSDHHRVGLSRTVDMSCHLVLVRLSVIDLSCLHRTLYHEGCTRIAHMKERCSVVCPPHEIGDRVLDPCCNFFFIGQRLSLLLLEIRLLLMVEAWNSSQTIGTPLLRELPFPWFILTISLLHHVDFGESSIYMPPNEHITVQHEIESIPLSVPSLSLANLLPLRVGVIDCEDHWLLAIARSSPTSDGLFCTARSLLHCAFLSGLQKSHCLKIALACTIGVHLSLLVLSRLSVSTTSLLRTTVLFCSFL